jgi:hypothetical protein
MNETDEVQQLTAYLQWLTRGEPRRHEVRILGRQEADKKEGIWDYDAQRLLQGDTDKIKGTYLTLNPGKIGNPKTGCMNNQSVDARYRIVIDIDPPKPKEFKHDMASATEHQQALDYLNPLVQHMRAVGFSEPACIDSGNGCAAIFPVDGWPTGQESTEMLGALFDYIQGEWGIPVDHCMGNASRIYRLPGTWNRKGRVLAERPFRKAKLLALPEKQEAGMNWEILLALVKDYVPKPEAIEASDPVYTGGGMNESAEVFRPWLEQHLAPHDSHIKTEELRGTEIWYHISRCPWTKKASEEKNDYSVVYHLDTHKLGYFNFHNGGQMEIEEDGKIKHRAVRWTDIRKIIDPNYPYTPMTAADHGFKVEDPVFAKIPSTHVPVAVDEKEEDPPKKISILSSSEATVLSATRDLQWSLELQRMMVGLSQVYKGRRSRLMWLAVALWQWSTCVRRQVEIQTAENYFVLANFRVADCVSTSKGKTPVINGLKKEYDFVFEDVENVSNQTYQSFMNGVAKTITPLSYAMMSGIYDEVRKECEGQNPKVSDAAVKYAVVLEVEADPKWKMKAKKLLEKKFREWALSTSFMINEGDGWMSSMLGRGFQSQPVWSNVGSIGNLLDDTDQEITYETTRGGIQYAYGLNASLYINMTADQYSAMFEDLKLQSGGIMGRILPFPTDLLDVTLYHPDLGKKPIPEIVEETKQFFRSLKRMQRKFVFTTPFGTPEAEIQDRVFYNTNKEITNWFYANPIEGDIFGVKMCILAKRMAAFMWMVDHRKDWVYSGSGIGGSLENKTALPIPVDIGNYYERCLRLVAELFVFTSTLASQRQVTLYSKEMGRIMTHLLKYNGQAGKCSKAGIKAWVKLDCNDAKNGRLISDMLASGKIAEVESKKKGYNYYTVIDKEFLARH